MWQIRKMVFIVHKLWTITDVGLICNKLLQIIDWGDLNMKVG